ncbi:MAG TPA: HAMP domain-containing sensor histidine kinase [Gemmatirosa sp.]|nr:HAMP domain-containing sensor histidine kinase [Gemmatirosa sp.]
MTSLPATTLPPAVPRTIGWSAGVAMATILVCLLLMVLVPVQHDRAMAPLRTVLLDVAEPARAEITGLHLALATGEALLRDHRLALGDAMAAPAQAPSQASSLVAFRAEVSRAAARTARLDTLAARWENAVIDAWVDSVRVASARWQETGDALLSVPLAPAGAAASRSVARAPDAAHASHYSATLVSAARLDAAVAAELRALRGRLEASERAARRWTVALAVLAAAGVAATLWLWLAVRRGALLAEARRRALAEALESKARFTRGMSHDLKNPLGAIDGHAALLEEEIHGPLTAAQRLAVGRMRRAVRTLLALVDDLLALARAEAGELAVQLAPTDLHALLRELADEHGAALQRSGLGFDVALPPGVRLVSTDAARVRQVLGNLLSNAHKYTPPGGRVSLTCCDGAGCVQVAVLDTGPGIPTDRCEFVFQEFSRLPGTTAPGAGLGLAISRRIARLLGGDLWADPEPRGSGARFVLELPLDAPGGPPHGERLPPGRRRSTGLADRAGVGRTLAGG